MIKKRSEEWRDIGSNWVEGKEVSPLAWVEVDLEEIGQVVDLEARGIVPVRIDRPIKIPASPDRWATA